LKLATVEVFLYSNDGYPETMSQTGFYTYMLMCADGTLYTGWSTDPQKRLDQHNRGKGAKYTRSRLPVELKAVWEFETKSEAMRFESALKAMTRPQKMQLADQQDR
jgi:putative endonuclease